jgi:hypothetical protein
MTTQRSQQKAEASMTEEDLRRLDGLLHTPMNTAEQFGDTALHILDEVPALIEEVRRLRALVPEGQSITFPPEPLATQTDAEGIDQAAQVLRDVGNMIGECCAEGTGFLLALFDTKETYEPVYTFNVSRGEALKALRRVTELVDRS